MSSGANEGYLLETVRALISEVLMKRAFQSLRLFLRSTATALAAPGAGGSEPSLLPSSRALLLFDQSQAHLWHLVAEARLHGDSSGFPLNSSPRSHGQASQNPHP